MMISTEPRVRWPAEVPEDCSLMGLLVATAKENNHDDIVNILVLAGFNTWNGIGLTMRDPAKRAKLAYVLDQPVAVVEARAHMLAGTIHGMDAVDFFGARIPAFDLLYDRRRIGGTDAREEFYHRALWQFIQLPVDHETGASIVDRCGSCGSKLGWRHIRHAWQCAAYRKLRGLDDPQPSGLYDCKAFGAGANDVPDTVNDQHLRQVRTLAELLDPRPQIHAPARDALHPDLRDMDRGIVFYLGARLGKAIALEGGGTRLRRAAPPPAEEALQSLLAGARIIREWPDGLNDIIREKAEAGHEKAMTAIGAVRRVCHGEMAWPEHRQIIGRAMPDIATGHYQKVVRRIADDTVDGQTAARMIGIRTNNMVHLVRPGVLKPAIARGTAKIHGSFLRADVEEIAAALKDCTTAGGIVEEFGITHHGVEQLICVGVLDRADHPAVLALNSKLCVTASSWNGILEKLDDKKTTLGNKEQKDSLRHAVLRIGGREKPWSAIITAMLDGSLPFEIRRPPGRWVDRIVVRIDDVLDHVLASRFDRRSFPRFPFASYMRQRDAIELLNIDPARYQEIKSLLPPKILGPNHMLNVAVARRLAARIIDKREARARWDQRLPRDRMIDDGLGWCRRTIERKLDLTDTK